MERKTFFKKVIKEIRKHDTIVILRHQSPDFDALGSQFGLKEWIKLNFKDKKVYACGEDHKIFVPKLYPYSDKDIQITGKLLVIVLDLANKARIDGGELLDKANYIIKIDHHPNLEHYANMEYVDDKAAAAAEILADMMKLNHVKINDQVSSYLYSGLVGDSGRFQYAETSPKTFEIAGYLVKNGANFAEIYDKMYTKSIKDIEINKYLYDSFKISKHGVGYYFIYEKDLEKLNIERDGIKAFVNLLAGYEEMPIWVQFSEDNSQEEYKWRVSIRSRGVKINDVAAMFNGGGHDNASGAKAKDMDEMLRLIDELDKLLIK